MATIKVQGSPYSTATMRPFGLVPAFEDGDLKLFESRAITQYINHEYADKGTKLTINDSKKLAIMRMWSEVESLHFDQAASKLVWELGIKPLFGAPLDPKIVEENENKLDSILNVYEKRLSESKYLG
ncbi:hypothetical protein TSUD_37970, partial [Trifolium subterraneum]